MGVFWASYVFDEASELLAQGSEHLVFILDRLYRSVSKARSNDAMSGVVWRAHHQGKV